MIGLTQAQHDTILVIQELFDVNGLMPTQREIANEMDHASKSSISRMIDKLVERKYLRRIGHGRIELLARVSVQEDVSFVSFFDPTPDLLDELP